MKHTEYFVRVYPRRTIEVNGRAVNVPINVPFLFRKIFYTDDMVIYDKTILSSGGRGHIDIKVNEYMEVGGDDLKFSIIIKPTRDYYSSTIVNIELPEDVFEQVWPPVREKYIYEVEILVEEGTIVYPKHFDVWHESDFSYANQIIEDIDFMGNIDIIIRNPVNDINVYAKYTSTNALSLSSRLFRIEKSGFIEHIKEETPQFTLYFEIGDIWLDNKIFTHRDAEKSKLLWLFKNRNLLTLECNISKDVESVGNQLHATTENLIIENITITQSYERANFYSVDLTLRKIEFVEPEFRYDYPYEIGKTGIKDGKVVIDDFAYSLGKIDKKEVEEDSLWEKIQKWWWEGSDWRNWELPRIEIPPIGPIGPF